MKMHRVRKLQVNEFNSFLTCSLCKGYLIDAYTINECLHSFCKSCIIKYIKRKECCPSCKIQIMKERMSAFIRRDVNLQCVVYKLVPDLFKNEMKRRRNFYSSHPKAVKFLTKRKICDKEALGQLEEDIFKFDAYSDFSLSVEYSDTGLAEICDSQRNRELENSSTKIYLECSSALTISILKKFLAMKRNMQKTSDLNRLDLMYDDSPLSEELTLLDVAYIYAWRRTAPMRLFYRINSKSLGSEKANENLLTQEDIDPVKTVLAPIENKLVASDLNSSARQDETEKKAGGVEIQNENNENYKPAIEEKQPDKTSHSLSSQQVTQSSMPPVSLNQSSFLQHSLIEKDLELNQTAESLSATKPAETSNTTVASTVAADSLTISAMVASIAREAKSNQQATFEQHHSHEHRNHHANSSPSLSVSSSATNKSEKENTRTIEQQPTQHMNQQYIAIKPNPSGENSQQHQQQQQQHRKKPIEIKPANINQNTSYPQAQHHHHQPPPPPPQYHQPASATNQQPMSYASAPLAKAAASKKKDTQVPNNPTAKAKPNPAAKKQKLVTSSPIPSMNTMNASHQDQSTTVKSEPVQNTNFVNPQQQFANTAAQYSAAKPAAATPTSTPPQFPSLMPALMNHFINSNGGNGNVWKSGYDYVSQAAPQQQPHNPYQAIQQMQSALISQKYLLDYFQSQSKSATMGGNLLATNNQQAHQAIPNYFNPQNFHHHSNNESQFQFNNCYAPQSNQQQQLQHGFQYMDDFKRPAVANFANFFKEAASSLSQQRGLFNGVHHTTGLGVNSAISNSNVGNLSGNSSNCSDSLDSLKETGLKISESCNLVNE